MPVNSDVESWRQDGDGGRMGLRITAAGCAAIGVRVVADGATLEEPDRLVDESAASDLAAVTSGDDLDGDLRDAATRRMPLTIRSTARLHGPTRARTPLRGKTTVSPTVCRPGLKGARRSSMAIPSRGGSDAGSRKGGSQCARNGSSRRASRMTGLGPRAACPVPAHTPRKPSFGRCAQFGHWRLHAVDPKAGRHCPNAAMPSRPFTSVRAH